MKNTAVLRDTEKFVRERLAGEGTGHDWWHIDRVRSNARLIAKTEQADMLVVELAVLLHDVGDHKVIGKADDDYSIAENFLRSKDVPGEIRERVMHIIQNMSFSKSLGTKRQRMPIEFQVVQDADRLDAIGAIGIARTFAYGGSKSRPLYDPTRKSQSILTLKQYRTMESSSFHHFEEKLLLLKGLMNTKTAKRIARERHSYMRGYMKQFLAEWQGKK